MIKWKDLQPLPSSIDLNPDSSHCLLEARPLRVMEMMEIVEIVEMMEGPVRSTHH